MSDILDIVDAKDNVIGKDTRTRIHKLKQLHRAVHILVFNKDGQLFLQKRSESKDTNPNTWTSSASGHVDSGESYEDAAPREMEEEIGVPQNTPLELIFKENARTETGHEFVHLYKCQYDGEMNLNEDEVSEGKWIACNDLDEWIRKEPEIFARSFRYLWCQLRLKQIC